MKRISLTVPLFFALTALFTMTPQIMAQTKGEAESMEVAKPIESHPIRGNLVDNGTYLAWKDYEPGTYVRYVETTSENMPKNTMVGTWEETVKLLMKSDQGIVLETTRYQGGVKMAPKVTTRFVPAKHEVIANAMFLPDLKVEKKQVKAMNGKHYAVSIQSHTDPMTKDFRVRASSNDVPGRLVYRYTKYKEGNVIRIDLENVVIAKSPELVAPSIKEMVDKLYKMENMIMNEYAYFMVQARELTPIEKEQLNKVSAVRGNLFKAIESLKELEKFLDSNKDDEVQQGDLDMAVPSGNTKEMPAE